MATSVVKDIDKYLKVASDLKLNLAFCGAHGRAKTSLVSKYCKDNGYELITIILSRLVPEDMVGLPVTSELDGEKVTKFSNPDWLVRASDGKSKILIFFDEFNNADVDVQASILDLIESRQANGLVLNDSTQIVMAFNPPSISPNAKNLSKATRDRICVIPFTDSDNTPYKNYYKNNGMEILNEVLTIIPEIVNSYDDEVVEETYKNAEFTFRSLEKSHMILEYCAKNKIPNDVADTMVAGYGGKNVVPFVNTYREIVKKINKKIIYEKVYKENGLKGVIELSKKEAQDDNTYGNDVAHANMVSDILTPVEFEKFINARFTKEFIRKYYA